MLLGLGMLVFFAFQPYDKPARNPIFSVSVGPSIGWSLISAIFFTFLAYNGFFVYPSDVAGGGLFLVIAGVSLYGAWRLWHLPTRKIEFYDDSFEVMGRGEMSILRYADVAKVAKVRTISFWLPITRIQLTLGSQEQLSAPGNPSQPKLKSDLYTWLLTKIN